MVYYVWFLVLFNALALCSGRQFFEVLINDQRINTIATGKSEKRFDAVGQYTFQDVGELAAITCQTRGFAMNMTISSGIGTHFQDSYQQSTIFIKLRDTFNGRYIQCDAYENALGIKELYKNKPLYAVRIYFFSRSTPFIYYPLIKVNNLALTASIQNQIEGIQYYEYEYYDGEVLSITSSINQRINQWECTSNSESVSRQLKAIGQRINVTITKSREYSGEVLKCPAAIIPFVLKLKHTYIFERADIRGLSLALILMKFQRDQYNYEIEYDVSENKMLHLTCSSNVSECEWEFDATDVTKFGDVHVDKRFITNETSFLIQKYVRRTAIHCKCLHGDEIYKTNVQFTNELSTPSFNTISNTISGSCEGKSGCSEIISIAVTIAIYTCVLAIGFAYYRFKTPKVPRANATNDLLALAADDALYEHVDYTACTNSGTKTAVTSDIANRPPCPLPPDVEKGNKKYIHYDTPYEHRLQHLLRIRPPKRKPCKCCPNQEHTEEQ